MQTITNYISEALIKDHAKNNKSSNLKIDTIDKTFSGCWILTKKNKATPYIKDFWKNISKRGAIGNTDIKCSSYYIKIHYYFEDKLYEYFITLLGDKDQKLGVWRMDKDMQKEILSKDDLNFIKKTIFEK